MYSVFYEFNRCLAPLNQFLLLGSFLSRKYQIKSPLIYLGMVNKIDNSVIGIKIIIDIKTFEQNFQRNKTKWKEWDFEQILEEHPFLIILGIEDLSSINTFWDIILRWLFKKLSTLSLKDKLVSRIKRSSSTLRWFGKRSEQFEKKLNDDSSYLWTQLDPMNSCPEHHEKDITNGTKDLRSTNKRAILSFQIHLLSLILFILMPSTILKKLKSKDSRTNYEKMITIIT